MKVGVVIPAAEVDGQGSTPSWPAIRSFVLAAEAHGLDSVWMFDHFFNKQANGPIEGMHEAWTIVSALAAVTERVEIGTLVLCSSFRSPALVAKMAATADEVSGGRLILGLGAGWHDPEYRAFGFPSDHRVDRFEESLQIIVPLLRGETVTFSGRYQEAQDAVLAPAPDRRHPRPRGGVRPADASAHRPSRGRSGTRRGSARPTSNSASSWRRSARRSTQRAETRPP